MSRIQGVHVNTISSGLIVGPNGSAELVTVNVNNGVPGAVLSIYDGTSTGGDLKLMLDASSKSSHGYLIYCNKGIFYDLAGGNADITIGYS